MHTTRFIYLAGPIAGCDKGEANDWREYVMHKLDAPGVQGVSPLRCEPLIGDRYELQYDDPRFGTPEAIGSKNWFDTNNCDIVLAYMPTPEAGRMHSVGTILEIGWARAIGKPVILVSDDEYLHEHPVMQYATNWRLTDLDDAIDVIEGVLGVYV